MGPDPDFLVMCAWVSVALVAALLFPQDCLRLPTWAWLQLKLIWINNYMRVMAFGMWLQLPKPRPPFRFIPVQDRKPPGR